MLGSPASTSIVLGLTAVLWAGACDGDATTASPGGNAEKTITQPTVEGIDVAPDSQRVDLSMPTFSNPTRITNPLFPISQQDSVLLVGHVDGKPFRTEVTLLPQTRIIEWEGKRVETLVSQYSAFLDSRLQEVAYDYYAQDDDGAVWYFGEDVADFADGALITTEGTWLAGKDGPAAMIMPADPKEGDAFRTENVPGFAFEEVTVTATGEKLDGPLGPVEGGTTVDELHMDGGVEQKTFAPGYGEFITSGGGDVEALALAVPTDATEDPLPPELTTLVRGAGNVFDVVGSHDWKKASVEMDGMSSAWDQYRAGDVPRRIEPLLSAALGTLEKALLSRSVSRARQAAIELAQWSLDLQLRYRPPRDVDIDRFGLWTAQLLIDLAARDPHAITGDVFTLDYIRDRIRETLDPSDLVQLNIHLGELQAAVVDMELKVIREETQKLRDVVSVTS